MYGHRRPTIEQHYIVELSREVYCEYPRDGGHSIIGCGVLAAYEGLTKDGAWAYLCREHFDSIGVGLGPDKGQAIEYVEPGSLPTLLTKLAGVEARLESLRGETLKLQATRDRLRIQIDQAQVVIRRERPFQESAPRRSSPAPRRDSYASVMEDALDG